MWLSSARIKSVPVKSISSVTLERTLNGEDSAVNTLKKSSPKSVILLVKLLVGK